MRAALLFVLLLLATPAPAAPKQAVWWWGEEHWGADLFAPYADPPMVTHPQQWAADPFVPGDWIRAYPGREAFVAALQRADIVVGLGEEDGIPEFTAGGSYKDLAPRDRARLAETLDALYGYTGPDGPGAFRIVDGMSGRALGLYTKGGFQAH